MAESWAVLFDLDGTLVDTAPDLAAAANRMREARSLPLLPLANLRPVTSQGASGLLRVAFGLQPEDRAFAAMRDEFLKNYQEHICEQTTLFPGMTHVLSLLEERGVAWGIVTNKPGFLTIPLIAALKLSVAPGAIVSGDTTARAKPDPLPVMHALQQLGATGKQSIMIGDDPRDILAGRAAGTQCWAAGWGYIEAGNDPEGWGADQVIRNSRSLELALLHLHTTQ